VAHSLKTPGKPFEPLGRWLRRRLTWSNSPRAWQERAGLALLLAGGLIACFLSDQLSIGAQVAIYFVLLAGLAFLFRQGWFTLLGPVFFYDLVRTTRRSHFALYRAYAYFVLVLLAIYYSVWWYGPEPGHPVRSIRDIGAFAQGFFLTFMSLQLLLAAAVTPGYVAGVIADEKDRRTLEYLLATDLRNREIVFSKLGARLANLLLMLLIGLPVMSVMEFMGGVDPDLVLLGFIATALTMISLASFGVLCSVHARKSREAILLTYLGAGTYVLLSLFSFSLYRTPLGSLSWHLGPFELRGGDLIELFTSGNPLVQMLRVAQSGSGRVPTIANLLRDYAFFHLTLSALCIGLACLRLRVVYLKQADGEPARKRWGKVRKRWIGVGNYPMLWREIIVERGFRFSIWGKLLRGGLVSGSFVPLLLIYLNPGFGPPSALIGAIGFWSRMMGALAACALLIAVAVRASTSISGERDRQTADNLLTTPLDSTTILRAKWLGNVLSVRWGWLWLGVIWGWGVVEGDLHVLALPLLILAWLVYASVFATLGLWFSLSCRTSQRATIFTVLSALAMGVGFTIIPFSVFRTPGGLGAMDRLLEWASRLQIGLTPPAVFGELLSLRAFPEVRFSLFPRGLVVTDAWKLPMALVGLFIWAAAGLVVWFVTSRRFRRITGRQALRTSEGVELRARPETDAELPRLAAGAMASPSAN
jgi:ABC-type transport system involved in multi-copper enzyme maturation permease subunit